MDLHQFSEGYRFGVRLCYEINSSYIERMMQLGQQYAPQAFQYSFIAGINAAKDMHNGIENSDLKQMKSNGFSF